MHTSMVELVGASTATKRSRSRVSYLHSTRDGDATRRYSRVLRQDLQPCSLLERRIYTVARRGFGDFGGKVN